ncbi:MAG: hypothetical protein LPK85_00385 [Gammaproteobacteria bacterium]|nr:hypothetical protein [Gammaproteobacteria bacterium]
MSTLQAFLDAARSVISFGATINAQGRQAIREVVGQLGDELDRALMLADSCLAGARYCRDDDERIQYLERFRGKLVDSFHEHQICGALYQLADRFEQVFDPLRLSVSIHEYRAIPALIDNLKNGERAVLDELDEIGLVLYTHAQDLAAESDEAVRMTRRAEIQATLDQGRAQLAVHRRGLRDQVREVMDRL